MKFLRRAVVLIALASLFRCERVPSSDTIQSEQQGKILQQGTSAVGLPTIRNFRERRLLKDIYELRDQTGLATYTYTYSEVTGKLTFFCNSIGYAIPYATQYTNPQKAVGTDRCSDCARIALPQADPNGLFSPADAEGTWIMCKDPSGPDVRPVYMEPRVVVSQFKLPTS